MALFTWTPDIGATVSHEPRIRTAKFGDGYEQNAADGLNANMEVWPLTFSNRLSTDIADINDFLVDKGGVTSFTFVSPLDGVTKSYLCKKWTAQVNGYPVGTATATFQQVPA